MDLPSGTTPANAKTSVESMTCDYGAVYYPWIKVIDPLSNNGVLRTCPISGHIMGIFARTINSRGINKTPAGTEALVRGAVELVTTVTNAELDSLSPIGCNCLIPKSNYGIVVWGGRSLSTDEQMVYVSDILLDNFIKKSVYEGTQWAVFEPNDQVLWTKLTTVVQDFMNRLWRDGQLYGTKASQAYFVLCDDTLNTQVVRDGGKVICQIGYAGKKPSEFVIFKFSHLISSN
jgi:phage tail sheath protein FI